MLPESAERKKILSHATSAVARFYDQLRDTAIMPEISTAAVRARLKELDFETTVSADEAIDEAMRLLVQGGLLSAHPRYFGLFNPTPTFMGVIADLLVSTVNPQLAAHNHHPAATEVEEHLVRYLAGLCGFDPAAAAGSFTSGGSEANATAVLLALTRKFPALRAGGMRALAKQPVFYVSAETHHSFVKIAHMCGLGRDAVHVVETDPDLKLSPAALERAIAADHAAGQEPFLVAATAGTTSAGIIDPLPELAELCAREGLHFHVDAAWGGGAVFSERLRRHLDGIERADTITIDAHKWLSVPIGTGVILTRSGAGLHETFSVDTPYIPRSEERSTDYLHAGIQWTRRFAGLRLFLTLLTAGRAGYAAMVERQSALGDLLRQELRARGWRIVNNTPLPVVCFTDPALDSRPPDQRATALESLARQLQEQNNCWISVTRLRGEPVLRACFTSYLAGEEDVRGLIKGVEE